MEYRELVMDLFSLPEEYYLAHCISADAHMSAGIAVEFHKRFHLRNKLQEMNLRHPDCVLVGQAFNLITKKKYFHKPTPETFATAVGKMKTLAVAKGVRKIAMPMIGAGLDRLSWGQNRQVIQSAFQDTTIEILVCKLDKKNSRR